MGSFVVKYDKMEQIRKVEEVKDNFQLLDFSPWSQSIFGIH